MRTTVDVPDDLMRQAKAMAALRGMKLKDLFAAFIQLGLSSAPPTTESVRREPLPVFPQMVGKSARVLTGAEVEEILYQEDIEIDRSA